MAHKILKQKTVAKTSAELLYYLLGIYEEILETSNRTRWLPTAIIDGIKESL